MNRPRSLGLIALAAGSLATAILLMVVVLTRPSGPARAVVDREAHNWGRVDPGAEVATSFTIVNRGRAPLRLGEPTTTCGCTKPKLPKGVLGPGERIVLPVSFHVPQQPGPVRHSITIPTNDPDRTTLRFDLHANAWVGVRARPQALQFGSVRSRQVKETTLQVYATDGKPFRVGRVSTDSPSFEARPEAPGAALTVHRPRVTFLGAERLGALRASVRVVTDRPDAAWIDVPVGVRVVGAVSVAPAGLQIESDQVGRDVERFLIVKANGSEPPPAIESAVASPPWRLLRYSARTPSGGNALWVSVVLHFPEGSPPKAGWLDLTVSRPERATHRIGLAARGWVAPLPIDHKSE